MVLCYFQVSISNKQSDQGQVDNAVNPILNQSLSSRILTDHHKSVRNANGMSTEHELSQFSRSNLHIYLILLSLEHARFSNASVPYNHLINVFPFDCSLNNMPCRPSNCVENIPTYAALQLLSKVGAINALQALQETHPYIDYFHHPLSQSTIVVASTGYDGKRMHKFSVCTHSHSNIGFQNFLKHMSKSCCCEGGETCSQTLCGDHELGSETETIVGYNTGDSLMHLQNLHSTIFTSDGVQVHIDKQSFLESSTTVTISLVTAEGHKIKCAKYNPFTCETEKFYVYESQSHTDLDSMTFCVSLSNGLKIATRYSDSEENACLVSKRMFSKDDVTSEHEDQQHNVEPNKMEIRNADRLKVAGQLPASHNQYQHLYMSTSNGLQTHVHVLSSLEGDRDNGKARRILVKQERYNKELSAQEVIYYLPSGTLVRYVNEKSLIILCGDGSMYRTASDFEYDVYNARSILSPSKKSNDHSLLLVVQSHLKATSEALQMKTANLWIVTLPNGRRYMWYAKCNEEKGSNCGVKGLVDELPLQLEDIPCFVATDPVTNQVSYYHYRKGR